MATRTEICNLAISHLAVGIPIGTWDADPSVEAASLRQFYPMLKDIMLVAADWPFAKKIATMGLVEEDPTEYWEYSYQVPNDCLKILRLVSDERVDTEASRVEYERIGDKIYTDKEEAEVEYLWRVEDEGMFSAEFVSVFALRLAIAIAPRLIGGDNQALMKRLYEQFRYELGLAQGHAANEGGYVISPESEYTRSRA